MKAFIKNTGQFHPMVAYVADVEPTDDYHGTGRVELLRAGLQITGFRYTDPDGELGHDEMSPAELDAAFPGNMHASASCYEIVVDHGTAAAAFLLATESKP